MRAKQPRFKYLILFSFVPLILSIGIAPSLLFVDFSQEADASKAVGPKGAKSYGSKNAGIVCGDRLCSESAPAGQASSASRVAQEPVKRIEPVSEDVIEEKMQQVEPMEEPMDQMMDKPGIDYEAEKSLIPVNDGGVDPLTVTPVMGNPTKQYEPHPMSPGQESLAENEMRVTMCGTGMPYPTWNQAATCIVVELGNGEKFIFDIGAGSISRLNGMGLETVHLNKVFITHLHVDHMGDLGVFLAQGFMRSSEPFDVYGPSGPNHELGSSVAFEAIEKTYQWDIEDRRGTVPVAGMTFNIHEFDYSKTQVIYEENDVTVTSFPAVHGIDGAVSYRLDWNDLSFAFSGDTKPNKFFVENSQDVDVLIHEAFATSETLVYALEFSVDTAENISEFLHTPPSATGIVFGLTNPRLAVMYHQILDSVVVASSYEELRKAYDGPTVFVQDLTIINVTPDYIVVRQGVPNPVSFPVQDPSASEGTVDPTNYPLSEFLEDSVIDWHGILKNQTKNNSN